MGRKSEILRINGKKFGNQMQKPCMKEMLSFVTCLAVNQNNAEMCEKQKTLLTTCMDAQCGNNRRTWASINYHLQRLNRGRK